MFRSLQTRFIIAYSACALLFMLSLIVMVYFQEREILFDMEISNSLDMSKLQAHVVGDIIEKRVVTLKNLADRSRSKAGDVPYILDELGRLKAEEGPLIVNTLFISTNGTVTNSTRHSKDVTDRGYYKKILSPDTSYVVSRPMKGRLSGRPLFLVGLPIVSDQNMVQGAVAMTIDLEMLSETMKEIKIRGNSFGWIADQDGTIVAHPVKEYPFNLNIYQIEETGFPGFDAIADSVNKSGFGHGSYFDQRLNKGKVVTYAAISAAPGWTLFISTLEEDIFRKANFILRSIAITGAAVLGLFIAVIVQLTKTITKPLNELTAAVRKSQSGDYARLEMDPGDDEIGRLVSAYNDMTETITTYTDELHEMVEDRTAELNTLNEQLNEQNLKLQTMATRDPLTGLFNRLAMEPIIEKEINRSKRFGAPVSLILIDIDHFKDVNDTFGHEAGDRVLTALAERLSVNCRKVDSTARWGGEEFIVLATETGARNAVSFAEKLRTDIMRMEIEGVGSVTVSAGVAGYRSDESFEHWFARADMALYRAKNNGRNRVEADETDILSDKKTCYTETLLRLNWDTSYSSGNETIDAQHKELIDSANEIIEAVLQDTAEKNMEKMLKLLYQRTAEHFSDEEKILKETGYTDIQNHAAEHKAFLNKLLKFTDEYQAGRIDDYKLLKFICRDMVIGHMINTDKDYFHHLMTLPEG